MPLYVLLTEVHHPHPYVRTWGVFTTLDRALSIYSALLAGPDEVPNIIHEVDPNTVTDPRLSTVIDVIEGTCIRYVRHGPATEAPPMLHYGRTLTEFQTRRGMRFATGAPLFTFDRLFLHTVPPEVQIPFCVTRAAAMVTQDEEDLYVLV